MYLPAYGLIEQCLRRRADQDEITIPINVFRKLLQLMAKSSGFDDDWYSNAYDDVAKALTTGAVTSALVHYGNGGYFEGRQPQIFNVDEDWYLKRYPDVAAGIDAGSVASGHTHYNQNGYFEGRVPSREMEQEIEEWNRLIKRHTSLAEPSPSETPLHLREVS